MQLQHRLEDDLMLQLVKKRRARVAQGAELPAFGFRQIQLARLLQLGEAILQIALVKQQTTEHAHFRLNRMWRHAIHRRLLARRRGAAGLHQVFRRRLGNGFLVRVNHGPAI